MVKHEFCDDCPGCRPAIASVDKATGALGPPLADDSPEMVAINQYWDTETTYAQRKGFIEVTLHNSQHAIDQRLAMDVMSKIGQILEAL